MLKFNLRLLALSLFLTSTLAQAIQIRADQLESLLIQDSELEFEIVGKDSDKPQLKIRGYINPYIKESLRFSLLPMNKNGEVKLIPLISDQEWNGAQNSSRALDYGIAHRCAMGDSVTYPVAGSKPGERATKTVDCSEENTKFEISVSLSAYKAKKAPVRILYGKAGEEVASFVSEKVLEEEKIRLRKVEEAARGNLNCPDCDARERESRLADLEKQLEQISSVVADDDKKESIRQKLAQQRKSIKKDAEKEAATKKEEVLIADIEKIESDLDSASKSKLSSLRARTLALKRRVTTEAHGKSEELNERLFKILESIAERYAEAGSRDGVRATVKDMRAGFKKEFSDEIKTAENKSEKRMRQKEYGALSRQAALSVQNGSAATFMSQMNTEVQAAEMARVEACADRDAGALAGGGVLGSDACTQATAHVNALKNIGGIPQRMLLGDQAGAQQGQANMWGIANPNAQGTNNGLSAMSGMPGMQGVQQQGNPFAQQNMSTVGNNSGMPHLMFPNTAGMFQNQALVNPLGMGAMPQPQYGYGQQQNIGMSMGQPGAVQNPFGGF